MKILRYIKVVIICAPVILYYHFRYALRFAKHPEKYSIEYRYKILRKEITFVLNRFKVNFDAENFESFSEGGKKLIICNHLSNLDPLFLIAMSEKPITFVSKKEAFDFPFVGKLMRSIEAFSLDRANLMKQVSEIKNVIAYLKDESKPSVVIFIEGTRNKHPEEPCLDFHPGTLKIAQKAGVPIVLTSIYGTFRVLDKRSFLKKFPIYGSCIRTLSVEEVSDFNTVDASAWLKKEVDDRVDLLRAKDKKYILESKNTKRRKRLETLVDARANS